MAGTFFLVFAVAFLVTTVTANQFYYAESVMNPWQLQSSSYGEWGLQLGNNSQTNYKKNYCTKEGALSGSFQYLDSSGNVLIFQYSEGGSTIAYTVTVNGQIYSKGSMYYAYATCVWQSAQEPYTYLCICLSTACDYTVYCTNFARPDDLNASPEVFRKQ